MAYDDFVDYFERTRLNGNLASVSGTSTRLTVHAQITTSKAGRPWQKKAHLNIFEMVELFKTEQFPGVRSLIPDRRIDLVP